MKALVWHGKEDIRCDTRLRSGDRGSARRHRQGDELRDLRLGPSSLSQFHSGDAARRHHGPRDDGRGGRGRLRRRTASLKKGDRIVVPFTIICGECEQCKRGNFSVCETHEPQQAPGRQGLRPHHGGPVRLHASDRRLSRRSGRISARPLCRRDAHQGAGQPYRRAGALPRRHLPDRLAGRRAMRHRADRHGRDLGLRSGRPDGDPQRDAARRQAGGRDRPPAGAAQHGGGRRRNHHQLRRGKRRRAAERADRRQGPGEVHRCDRAWKAT